MIGLVVAKTLMGLFPDACEGRLSRWRSSLVSRKTLAEIAVELRMGEYIFLGRGERRSGGAEKRSILAAVLESVVGALYLDGGLERVESFLVRVYRPWFDTLAGSDGDPTKLLDRKTHLQERTQSLYKTRLSIVSWSHGASSTKSIFAWKSLSMAKWSPMATAKQKGSRAACCQRGFRNIGVLNVRRD